MEITAKRIKTAAERVLGHEWADPVVRDKVAAHAKSYTKSLRNLSWPPGLGAKKRQTKVYGCLTAFSSRFCCVVRAANRRSKQLSFAEIEAIAASISPYRDCGEPIRIKLVKRSDGTDRTTIILGLRRWALATLVGDVLKRILPDAPSQYCRTGRGTGRAIRSALASINEEQLPWVLSCDIQNCHPSIGRDNIPELIGLPAAIVENVIFVPKGAPLKGTSLDPSPELAVRHGLPQGVPTSELIAAFVLQTALKSLTADSAVVAYADNLLIACASKEEAVAKLEALRSALQSHLAGQLELHKVTIRHVSDSTFFLGYDIRYDESAGEARACPTPANTERFLDRLHLKMAAAPSKLVESVALREAASFRASFGAWKLPKEATETIFSTLEDLALELAQKELAQRAEEPPQETVSEGAIGHAYALPW